MKCITTSWDDGHPLDFKIAGLLKKYNMQGTFYIPRANEEHAVMTESEIVELSKSFEIGGHTLNHIRLCNNVKAIHEYEIAGSFKWLKELLKIDPVSFCFPGGVYNKHIVECVRAAGYILFRTTELLSIKNKLNPGIIPTSLQVYEHSQFTYFKHLVKRKKIKNLLQWMQSGTTADIMKLADFYIRKIELNGEGCFHLWGHSWEIEEFGLWNKLEVLLKHLSGNNNFSYVPNKDL